MEEAQNARNKPHLSIQIDNAVIEPPQNQHSPTTDLLKEHREKYSAYKKFAAKRLESKEWDIDHIIQQMKDVPIKCTKYNYSLED